MNLAFIQSRTLLRMHCFCHVAVTDLLPYLSTTPYLQPLLFTKLIFGVLDTGTKQCLIESMKQTVYCIVLKYILSLKQGFHAMKPYIHAQGRQQKNPREGQNFPGSGTLGLFAFLLLIHANLDELWPE